MPRPVDLDLRVVRYFATVAQHRHFGRAAAALHMTQPSLSRQIAGLEKRLGTTLFERTAQGSLLTEAGVAFATYAEVLLDTAARAVAHTRAAGQPRRLVVGYTSNLVVTAAVHALRQRHPDAEVITQHLPWNGARAALLDRRVDIAVTRLPIAANGLDVAVLYQEPRAVLLSREHRLAGRAHLSLADIAGEPIPRTGDPGWDTFWRNEPHPADATSDAPVIDDVAALVDHLASGAAVAIVPADSRLPDLHPALVAVPLPGVEPGEVAVARRSGETGPLIDAFHQFAAARLSAGAPSVRHA
ncbi:LysR family transcriptional regulator [Mycolicibacterium sp. 018/SC-01/001]|uniref:LysR family transcriptional regulator n=1 Tax=Mycolicibacterium sp. 018/SC-01/001 TaxID=2592069 RepID=UPI00117E2F9A|nr:LysR family transcriptional regulator [Mycolicibacterium sp. 018/SC-01/001]TRW78862.1 LysR family transcriptional regulator [Mycolicibacterium sp. 018/SC-01/001]